MKSPKRDTLPRSAMKLLCTLLGIILVFLLGTTAALQQLLDQIHYTPAATPIKNSALSIYSAVTLTELSGKNKSETIGGAGSDIINILLIGQDGREGEEGSRSDSMILCTFHRKTKQVTMTSFLRDLYVKIPGHSANRINAAYSLGGTSLLDQTLSENFSLHIDGNVEVDFTQFSGIVDALGGVELELRQDEADFINRETGSQLEEGLQSLNGEQALMYSRIRKLDLDGDMSRTNRQRKVINALLQRYKNTSITKLLPTLNKLMPMITTDMNQGQILLCAMEVLPYLADAQIISQSVPAEGSYRDETIDGMSVLVTDTKEATEQLRSSLLDK